MGHKPAAFGTHVLLYLTVSVLFTSLIPPARMPVAEAARDRRLHARANFPAPVAAPEAMAVQPPASTLSNPPPVPQVTPKSTRAHATNAPPQTANLGGLPITFIPNVGQADLQVRFQARALGGNVLFTRQGVVYIVPAGERSQLRERRTDLRATRPVTVSVARQRFDGAATNPAIEPLKRLAGIVNFYNGADATQWRTNVTTYAGIVYRQLYTGIDLRYESETNGLKSTYAVAAGADPTRIRWRYEGATRVQVDTTGSLLITLPGLSATQPVTLTESAPVSWQVVNGQRVFIATQYTVASDGVVGFRLGSYDTTQPLTIDPTLGYLRLIAGSASAVTNGIAVYTDPTTGSTTTYVAGYTDSTTFPTIPTVGVKSGQDDGFVAKLSGDGTQVLYVSYFGGASGDSAQDIAVDDLGNPVTTGYTTSVSSGAALFPTTANAYHAVPSNTNQQAFITKIDGTTGQISYSSFFGNGTGSDIGTGIATYRELSSGIRYTYISGSGYALDEYIGYIAKFNLAAIPSNQLIYNVTDAEYINDVAVDVNGNAYVTGIARNEAFENIFVTKLNANGSQYYFTTVGNTAIDIGAGVSIDVDSTGQAFIFGTIFSPVLQPTTGAYRTTCGLDGQCNNFGEFSLGDGFIAGLRADGTVFYKTYLGLPEATYGGPPFANLTIGVDTTGMVYIVSASTAFSIRKPLPTFTGVGAFLAAFDLTKTGDAALIFGTPLLATGDGVATGLIVTSDGVLYATGVADRGSNAAFFVIKLANVTLFPDQNRTPEACPCASSQPTTQHPVNTRTGNFWTQSTDIQVESPGPILAWSRLYASQAVTETGGLLGAGWQHPYAARIITPTTEPGRLIVLTGGNNRLRYTDLGNGTFAAAPGVYSTLVRASGVFTHTLVDQSQHIFDSATGRLNRTRDLQGRQLNLIYTGSPARLTRIEDAADSTRFLALTYSTGGQIATVSDGSRTISYFYTNGDLTTSRDIRQKDTIYQYYANHLLKNITNPLGQLIEAVDYTAYTAQGKVKQQTLQDGQLLQFQYLSNSTVITATGVDGRRDVQRIDYADNNTLTGMTNTTLPGAPETVLGTAFDTSFSPAVIRDGNDQPTQTVYSPMGLPVVETDALGQQRFSFYDSRNRLTRTIDPLGIETHIRYDSFNNVISTTLGITTSNQLRATTLYTYTVDGRLLTDQRAPDGVVTHYDYTGTRVNRQIIGFGSTTPLTTTYGYDSAGRVETVTTWNGATAYRVDKTIYNSDNSANKTIQNFKDGTYSAAKPDEDIVTEFGYDDLGRRIWVKDIAGRYDVTHYDSKNRVDWTARNLTGYSGGALPTQPPAYSPGQPDANIASFYGYDGLGRTALVTETGILTGTFNLSTLQFSAVTNRVTRTEYDVLSRPITVTLNYRPGQPASADTNVQLISAYDGASNLIAQRDGYGRWTQTAYDALSRPITVTVNLQDGNPLTGPRDADIVSVTRYDAGGRVIRQIDNWVDGTFSSTEPITDRVTLSAYNSLGQVITTTLSYDPSQTTRTDTNRRTIQKYDPVTTRLLGTQDPLKRWQAQQYDALGRVTALIQNCWPTGSYTPQAGVWPGNCAASGTAERNVTTRTRYDPLGRSFETVDPLGVVTRTGYDVLSRATSTIQNYVSGGPTDQETNVVNRTGFDGLGRTTVLTDALGFASRMGANRLGQTVAMTDTLGRVTRMGYDGSGSARWTRLPDGRVTVQQVDGLGRVTATITNYQDGVVAGGEPSDRDLISRTTYDVAGRIIRQVDTATRVTVFAYDNQDHLISVTENQASGSCATAPCNVQTQYQYDRAGNRTVLIDPRGNIRRLSYDAADRTVEARDGLNRATGWQYDAAGNRTFQDDPRGSTYDLTMQYDGLNRVLTTTATLPANLAPISANYNARSERTNLSDGTGNTSFSYDPLGRMKQLNAPDTGIVGYHYNARGDRTRLTYPGSGAPVIDYAYFADRQLQTVTQSGSTLATYAYDRNGRLAQLVRLDGVPGVTNYQYDSADRMRAVRSTTRGTLLSAFLYQTDRLGMRTSVTDTMPANPTPSSTWLKSITFEADNLTNPVSGADSVGGTVVLDTVAPLKGGISAKIANTSNSYVREDIALTDELYASFYLRIDAAQASGEPRIAQIRNGASGSEAVGTLQLTTDRRLKLRNEVANITIGTSTPLTIGTIYRVVLHQKKGTGSNGVLDAALATGDGALTTFAQSTGQSFTSQISQFRVGTASTALSFTADDIVLDRGASSGPSPNGAQRIDQFGAVPLSFIPNTGQTDARVAFHGRGLGGSLFFSANALTMALPSSAPITATTRSRPISPTRTLALGIVHQRLVGANATPVITGTQPLPGRANLFLGKDPARWRTDLPTYSGLVYRDVYPGIDLHYDGSVGQLKSTYRVRAGADPRRIRWWYDGAQALRLTARGDLQVTVPVTETGALRASRVITITEQAPEAWQEINGEAVAVPVQFALDTTNRVRFTLGSYDPARPLLIDPVLSYGTYLGGSGSEGGSAIAVDAGGNTYVTGGTSSLDFPLQNPLQTPANDIYVSKLAASGTTLLYSTYLGGSGDEESTGIAVDSSGNAVLAGYTDSTNLPVVAPYQATKNTFYDGFVMKLNASGSALTYSTYLGGNDADIIYDVALDSASNATITGFTYSTNYPVANAIQATKRGTYDVIVTSFNATGSALRYSTYIGGGDVDQANSIAVDSAGNAYIAGNTSSSSNYPTANAMQPTYGGGTSDAMVTKLVWNGTSLSYGYSTFLGGAANETAYAIAVDSAGNAVITGRVDGAGFPTTSPWQATHAGGYDMFITKLNASGNARVFSTYFGGSGDDESTDIGTDSTGNVIVSGATNSLIYPTRQPIQATCGGCPTATDGVVTKLSPSGSLVFSTYFGGSSGDQVRGLAVESSGTIYLTGWTGSTDLPTTSPWQAALNGSSDTFIAKLSEPQPVTAPEARTTTYSYDGLNRLVGAVETPGTNFSYSYDLAGNRTSVRSNGALVETRSYDAADQLLGFGYDPAGNLLNDKTGSLASYDALNRMTQRGSTSFSYSGDGVLVSQTTSGATTRYTQDLAAPLPQILQYLAGGVLTNYAYGVERLGGVNSVTRRWHHADALGSLRRSVDDAGSVSYTQFYDPWGHTQIGTPGASFGFTGEFQNASSGLLHLRARWYNVGQGRFGSVDPFPGMPEQPQSLASFNYAHNNPINFTDPTGKWRWRRTSSAEHRIIEDVFLSTGLPSSFHAEFDDLRPISPRYPLIVVDVLRSDTGDVWEIEPITARANAVPEASVKTLVLNLYGRYAALIHRQPNLSGYYRGLAPRIDWSTARNLGKIFGLPRYDWNHVDWRLGSQANFSPIRIPRYINAPPIYADLVAASTAPGEVLFWFEPEQAGEAAFLALIIYLGSRAALARQRGDGPIRVPDIPVPSLPQPLFPNLEPTVPPLPLPSPPFPLPCIII